MLRTIFIVLLDQRHVADNAPGRILEEARAVGALLEDAEFLAGKFVAMGHARTINSKR